MKVLLVAIVMLIAPQASAQGVQWLQPSSFDLTCQVQRKCVVETSCVPHADQVVIRHQINEGPTHFELPEGAEMRGVLGKTATPQGQALLGSATPAGARFYRVAVFPDGSLTVGVLNAANKDEDVTYYGTCVDMVG